MDRREIENWNRVLHDSIRVCLFREPTLSDYTYFRKEKMHTFDINGWKRQSDTVKLFWKGIELGIVKNVGGKLKFIVNE